MINQYLNAETLPIIFMGLMMLAVFLYAIFDGYDLGIGMLFPFAKDREERNRMVSTIGPFWDANETWIVLGVGILFIAFPQAYGEILTAVYIPVVFMLIGLIIRACAFDFRVKAKAQSQAFWDKLFALGSYLASFCQGMMIGLYITGLQKDVEHYLFAILVGISVCFAYMLLGACWLVCKSESELRIKAIHWIRRTLFFAALVVVLISIATPFTSAIVKAKWFNQPLVYYVSILPILTAILFIGIYWMTSKLLKATHYRYDWVPYFLSTMIGLLAFLGLGYSLYPNIILDRLSIFDAGVDPKSLLFVLAGASVVLPLILLYTLYVHHVFRGKMKMDEEHY